ncbi:MAG: helix-turn-helix domain-containing protein [Gemmataceae bacterium]
MSARDQRHKKRNTPRLREYDKFLRRELRKLGFSVCRKSFKAKVSGKLLVDERMQRKLAKAARYAKARGAVLGFFSTDRILRSEHYIDTNQGAQPTVEEFEMLKEVTRGVQLGSFMHPDESWQVVREEQTKLGGKCGRPKEWEPGDTKRRRIELRPEVLVLREQGVSVAEISERFAVPIRTVYSWLAA